MFILNVVEGLTGGYTPDYDDYTQEHAFLHLFPKGYCPWIQREVMLAMVGVHGWGLSIQKGSDEETD